MISARTFTFSLLLVMFSGCQLFLNEGNARPSPPLEPDPLPSSSAVALPEMSASEPPPAEPPPPSEPAIQPTGEQQTRGRVTKRALEAGVAPGMKAFEGCYERVLAQRPGLRGSIVVNFVVAPDGSVPYAGALEQGTDLPDAQVIDCVLDEFQKLHFEPPVGGRAVATYPLSFAPKAGSDSKP